jgi:hypothetical protein
MNVDRPKLTPELALKELEQKMKREQEEAHISAGQSPAQILSQNLDYTRLSASGINEVISQGKGTSSLIKEFPPVPEIVNRSVDGNISNADSQMTSNMIK